jgi:putative Mn2+ efflux pump MntP
MAPSARLLSTLLFGIAANTDNLSVGFAYGLKRRPIGWPANLLIGVVTTAITLIALFCGRLIRLFLPAMLPGLLGGGLLVALAAWSLWHDRLRPFEPSALATRFSGPGGVGFRETMLLSGVLSINNIGLAIAGGIGGIGYAPAAASIFCFSVAMLLAGQVLSMRVAGLRTLGGVVRSPFAGNLVLLMAGVAMLVGY